MSNVNDFTQDKQEWLEEALDLAVEDGVLVYGGKNEKGMKCYARVTTREAFDKFINVWIEHWPDVCRKFGKEPRQGLDSKTQAMLMMSEGMMKGKHILGFIFLAYEMVLARKKAKPEAVN